MAHTTKIATCCYCGLRTALVIDRSRHELVCAGCGAPLHDLKRLPLEHQGRPDLVRPSKARPGTPKHKSRERKKNKRRKYVMRKIFEEVTDLLEDVFD